MLIRTPVVTNLLRPRFDGSAAPAVDNTAQRLLQNKLDQVEGDNAKYRVRLREYRALGKPDEIEAKLKLVPADGMVAVSAADAAALKSYQELGKPEDLKKKIEAGEKAITDLAVRDHESTMAEAAEAAEYNVKALKKLPGVDKLKFEVRKEKVDGKDADVAYVTDTATQGAAAKKLTEHAEAAWPEFLNALQTTEAADTQTRSSTSTFPAQRRSSTGREQQKPATVEETAERKRASGNYSL